MKTIKKLSLLFLATFVLWSCSDDDDGSTPTPTPQPLNIVETAQATANLSSLVAAIIEADLAVTLSGSGPFTVLAPTNEAFAEFMSANGWATVADIPDAALEQTLLNHVISGTVTSTDLVNLGAGYTNTLADGLSGNKMSLYFDTSNGVQFNGLSTVDTADISATNGIVHIVDEVIALPTLLTFATADPTFDSLEASVLLASQAGVATALTNASATSPLTVLAPTNDAFTALLATNPMWNGPADIDATLLSAVLTHHVTAGNVASTDLTDPGITTAPSVQGQNFSITLPGTNGNIADVTDGSGNTDIGIIAVDVQASNGVIHAVNKVLLPM